MTDAVLLSACRTAIGTARKGALREVSAFDLATTVVREAAHRSGLPPESFDDVVLGESMAGGGDIARYAALEAGLTRVPGLAQNRHCASGLASVATAAAGVRAGMDRAVIAGGTQSSSTAPVSRRRIPGTEEWQDPWSSPSHVPTPESPNQDMSILVGWNTARLAGVSRAEMDAWALRSHERAIRAIDAGRFADEIVPVKVAGADGAVSVFDVDEHPRRGTSLAKLAALKVLHPEIEGFSITAGNSSGVNDGAAALVVADAALAADHGLTPLATVRSWASVGVDPVETGLAPIAAIRKALGRAGIEVGDVDLFEVNEAFASVAVAAARELGLDEKRVNPFGSGCSLGHPIAMTGARMVTTLAHELRRRGGGTAVAAMCAGGGMGSALVLTA
ncbi:acetyl-CoA C-acetyltransferase [Amycolatopsis mediterranei S699]|uniref:Probable acetyl-CoA acetyltransferase n=2 Tax=Amycolatopsis mediterranei TaxID=33910 RepID=A0A0H3DFC7_AMYMU|nr:thiolase family protein [Amycolatopsis mediterranei]ADJ48917.1 acetyl-CoA C-acetyltransferase [Amycolatopsis mediterranei U32]AEK45866.1 acetyl-CoA C-acetyltransferase [Amycolatopsis mediterranei S699]AFO80625.1 acetyl-CoA C-acetyltransferase [Amycolatopsis mediterranei S699]AGT87753.1 acetyl-CoA C-acetyltransferase [Amycolatopsis mediterranei RB]KDU93965.1 acetyl-CoA acetyltransferase [Amycolatopsis mediterranei]